MAYSKGANRAHMDMVSREMISGIFQQCIPPDTRMWMNDGLKIEVMKDTASASTRLRISYRPTPRVVPKESLYMELAMDEVQFEALVKGQFDFLDTNGITDYFLKLLMVYSLEAYEYDETASPEAGWK